MPATERMGEQIETALYVCQEAPYRRLDLQDLVMTHWTISHVVEGTVTLTTGGHTYVVRPGDVMIHPPDIPFSETNPSAGVHLWMACEARLYDPHPENLLDRYPLPPVVTLSRERDDAYQKTFASLVAVHQQGGNSGTARLRRVSLLTELLAYLIEAWEESGSPLRPRELASPSGRFAPVLSYLRKHLSERITRADLADLAVLHPTAFDRAFVRAMGQSPMRLLTDLRLAEARRRLEVTDETLETIARAVGLNDAAHLSRLFRARFGMPPGKWREGVNRTKTGYIPPLLAGE